MIDLMLCLGLMLSILTDNEKPKRELTNSFDFVAGDKRASNFSHKSSQGKSQVHSVRSFVVTATAYTLAEGSGSGKTATGTIPKEGRTVSVDPRLIPLGSKIQISGYKWGSGAGVAEDTGGKIKGARIDLFFRSRKNALMFGRRKLQIHVLVKK